MSQWQGKAKNSRAGSYFCLETAIPRQLGQLLSQLEAGEQEAELTFCAHAVIIAFVVKASVVWFAEVLTQVTARACKTGAKVSVAGLPPCRTMASKTAPSYRHPLFPQRAQRAFVLWAYHFLTVLKIRLFVLEPGLDFKQFRVWRNDCHADPHLGGSQGDGHTALLLMTRFHFHCWGSYCGVSLWKRIDAGRKFHTSVFILEATSFQGENSLKLQQSEP